ncbi:MAG: metallophosphoesterase [Treponema sp.]|jgi:3',5'-cyclic AMP phosphodiesterase CpdA|nr:metallophosphoesterase [Treponema sp.]
MKKTAAVKAACIIFCAALCAAFTTCKDEYGLNEFLNRADDVNARSAYITEIGVPTVKEEDIYKQPADSFPFGNDYTVLILADIHFGAHPDHPDAPESKFFAWLDAQDKKPAFCLVLGDSAEAGTEEEYKAFKGFADTLEAEPYKMPVYSIIGNHDLYNNGWRHYTKYCKPYVSYYHFSTGTFSWYALDSGSGTLGGGQLKNLVSNLKADPKPKIVFSHYPMYGGGNFYFSLSDPHERAALIAAFAENNVKIVLEGHQHPGSFYDFGSFREYNAAAFRDRQSWHLLTINETAETVTFETVKQ